MSQSNNQAVGVDNTFQRKFDREEYLERAREREEKAVGVGNTFRRKFDREEYLERAREREEKENDRLKPKSKRPLIQRKPLKHRDYEVDLESRLGKIQWVLKKVVRDEPAEQTDGEQVTQFSAEPTAALITKHNTTTSSIVDPTNVGMVKPKPAHPLSTPEQTNKSSSLIRGSPIVDEIPAQVTVASSLLNKFDSETTAPQVSNLGEDEPITKA